MRIGNGFDVHPFSDDPARPLVLAGVHIPEGPGLAGHSDADVVAHASADAVLGALALGDLGSWFGVDRPEYADADSLRLLGGVITRIRADGWAVGNLDVTVVAQQPLLAAHRDTMRANLADALHAPLEAVSVKFTTTDGLGAVGRGEGIASWVSVLLERA